MDCAEIQRVISSAALQDWSCEQVSGEPPVLWLSTPWLLPNNDCIEILIEPSGDLFNLTDAGNTYNFLLLSGIDLSIPDQKSKRHKAIKHLENFRAHFDGHEIVVQATADNIAPSIKTLIEAIKSVSSLIYLQKPTTHYDFKDQVFALFAAKQAKIARDYPVTGYVREQHFDLRLNGNDETLIRTISSSSPADAQARIERAWFAFNDVQKTNRKFAPLIIYDDSRPERKGAWRDSHFDELQKLEIKALGYEKDKKSIVNMAERHQ